LASEHGDGNDGDDDPGDGENAAEAAAAIAELEIELAEPKDTVNDRFVLCPPEEPKRPPVVTGERVV